MTKTSLQACISSEIQISPDCLEEINQHFHPKSLRKGAFFLKAGRPCREMAFIEKGYLRMFDIVNGNEITLWIGSTGNFITSLSSFALDEQNFWNIQAISDVQLQVISLQDHKALGAKCAQWIEFDNLLLARSYALLERSMFAQLHTTAKQRYEALWQENPAIFNHVPLQYIASMLGIKPETLSRLRKQNA